MIYMYYVVQLTLNIGAVWLLIAANFSRKLGWVHVTVIQLLNLKQS